MTPSSVYVLLEEIYRDTKIFGVYADLQSAKAALLEAVGHPGNLRLDPPGGTYWDQRDGNNGFELNQGYLVLWMKRDRMPFRIEWREVEHSNIPRTVVK